MIIWLSLPHYSFRSGHWELKLSIFLTLGDFKYSHCHPEDLLLLHWVSYLVLTSCVVFSTGHSWCVLSAAESWSAYLGNLVNILFVPEKGNRMIMMMAVIIRIGFCFEHSPLF